jgi:hypothetical protein
MGRRKISGPPQAIDPGRKIQAAGPSSSRSAGRKQPTQLTIPPGQPDTEKISVLVREWLVPMLVRKFLSDHPPTSTTIAQKPTFQALGKEDVG